MENRLQRILELPVARQLQQGQAGRSFWTPTSSLRSSASSCAWPRIFKVLTLKWAHQIAARAWSVYISTRRLPYPLDSAAQARLISRALSRSGWSTHALMNVLEPILDPHFTSTFIRAGGPPDRDRAPRRSIGAWAAESSGYGRRRSICTTDQLSLQSDEAHFKVKTLRSMARRNWKRRISSSMLASRGSPACPCCYLARNSSV